MELFTRQIELIREMGFMEWLRCYPVNPITMVMTVLIFGMLVLLLNAKIRKKNAEKNKPEGAAILVLKKQNSFNDNFAEQVRVLKVNGRQGQWFFYKARPAIYLPPGDNEIVVYAEWAQSVQKLFKTESKKLQLKVKQDTVYTLYYVIQTAQYLIYEGDKYEDKNWESTLNKTHIVG